VLNFLTIVGPPGTIDAHRINVGAKGEGKHRTPLRNFKRIVDKNAKNPKLAIFPKILDTPWI
jgi:hypothetical protein